MSALGRSKGVFKFWPLFTLDVLIKKGFYKKKKSVHDLCGATSLIRNLSVRIATISQAGNN